MVQVKSMTSFRYSIPWEGEYLQNYFIDHDPGDSLFDGSKYEEVPAWKIDLPQYSERNTISKDAFYGLPKGTSRLYVLSDYLKPIQGYDWFVVDEVNDKLVLEIRGAPEDLVLLKLTL